MKTNAAWKMQPKGDTMAGRRGQYISTSELDEKIFALIVKDPTLSESEIVKQALYKHFNLTRTLKKIKT